MRPQMVAVTENRHTSHFVCVIGIDSRYVQGAPPTSSGDMDTNYYATAHQQEVQPILAHCVSFCLEFASSLTFGVFFQGEYHFFFLQ